MRQLQDQERPVVAIIGGGASGAGVAYHIANSGVAAPGTIVIFEPRAKLGAGLAYDTPDPAHRINVPSTKMSLLPEQPEHFQAWLDRTGALAGDDQARSPHGQLFPRRMIFGDYMNATVKPLVDSGGIRHIRLKVTAVSRVGDRWQITDDGGDTIRADIVVIATSHPAPVAPQALTVALAGHPRFVADPTRADALDAIRADDRVLIVGNGLTSADVIASLALRGHRGRITAISRRGLRSRGHAATPQDACGDFASTPAATALALLKNIRAAINAAAIEGKSWHGVIDQVRWQGKALWSALPETEKRRVVRHLRPYWDVHRFRIAPQVEAAGDEAIQTGRLEVLTASIDQVERNGEAIECRLRLRRSGESMERSVDAVVVTTGPGHKAILGSQAWLADMAQAGHIALDRVGLGLACSPQSQAMGEDGRVSSSLYVSGPLARGTFGELMGMPEISEHAVFVAKEIVEVLKQRAKPGN